MKKVLLIPVLFISINVSAKNNKPVADTSTIEKLYEYIFANLDKTQISTGYLEEYGVPLLNMQPYNGVLTDSNIVDITTWRTLYWQIQSAYVGTGTNSFGSPVAANAAIKALQSDDLPIPIPVLFARYNVVKSTAFTKNLLKVENNQVLDVAGRSGTPYTLRKLFAACPLINTSNTGSATFVFQKDIFFKTYGSTNIFYIDFADGKGYQGVGWNTPISVSYTDTGYKKWKIKMLLNNGDVYECYSEYYVGNIVSTATNRYPYGYSAAEYFASTGSHSGGLALIRYSSKNTTGKLKKPLIVAEGFDAHSVAPNIVPANYSYYDFIQAINAPKELYDFSYYLDDVAGYDIVFVDYNKGTDDIKRNAALLEDIITWVNQQKALNGSTEQNVVMGLSMGGLVARYALADMTKTQGSSSTGTRLLITHDSPHRGANIPLGLQNLIFMIGNVTLFKHDIRDIYPDYDEAVNLLSETATQQMLLYRATGETTSSGNSFLDGEYRTKITFATSDPQPSYQFVATSLGSECGTALYPAYQKLITMDASAFAFMPPLATGRFRTTVDVNALPATGSTVQIAKLYIRSQVKLFGLISVYKDIHSSTAYAPGDQIPVDGAPGGIYGTTNKYDLGNIDLQHANIFLSVPVWFSIFGHIYTYAYAYVYGYTNIPYLQFDFIPEGSALNISPFTTATLSQKFVAGANPDYPSAAKTYIAQEATTDDDGSTLSNNYHIQFTARNSQWMYDQMEGISDALNCSSSCTPDYTISGSSAVCTNSTYSVSGLADGATVTWSASPAALVSFSPVTGSSTTVTKLYNGTTTISAKISPCGQTITKSITSGLPDISGTYTNKQISYNLKIADAELINYNDACNLYHVNTNMSITGASSVKWSLVSSSGTISWSQSGNNISFYLWSVGSTAVFKVSATNSCGTSTYNFAWKSIDCGRCAYSLSLSPNPADNILQVALLHSCDKTTAKYIKKITVFDANAITRIKKEYTGNIRNTALDVSSLSPGIYLLEVFDGISINRKQFLIRR